LDLYLLPILALHHLLQSSNFFFQNFPHFNLEEINCNYESNLNLESVLVDHNVKNTVYWGYNMPYVLLIFQFYILFELNLKENVKKKQQVFNFDSHFLDCEKRWQ
jgi:hypothetical protein